MRFYKLIENGYILGIGTGGGGTEITAAEYDEIMTAIQTRPTETEETGYRLKTNLTWESYAKPAPDPDPDAEDSDILEAIGGVL